MDILSPLILLHQNGYKALAATDGSDDPQRAVRELRDKIVRVGEGDLEITVGFDNRNDELGSLGRAFNHMVHRLHENREEVERLHRAQISRAECLTTAGELAVGLAHEIRNLLASITGVIEVADRDLPVTSPARAAVRLLRAEIAQIKRILTDLLQAARPHTPEMFPTDLNTTVEQAVLLVRQQKLTGPITISLQKHPNLPAVEHDSGQIHQLLLNLLLNAVQAIDGPGEIRVETSLLRGDAAISISDTGRGIAAENLPNLFKPFFTTKEKGTGLGLSLARRTAEEHRGWIEVTSQVGRGTKFLVILPLQQSIAQAAPV
jgi:signal transduction histidine kinase